MKTKSYNHYKVSVRLAADYTSKDNGNVLKFRAVHNIGSTPMFLNCVIFVNKGKKFEKKIDLSKLTKGNELLLEGSLRPNTWTDKNGVTRNDLDFIVSKVNEPEVVEDNTPDDDEAAEAPEAPAAE